jgi:DNA-binding response OmpR family regulator
MNRILIMDNEEAIQLLYLEELTEEGYEVITSGDGLHLMDLIEEHKPDLVVMEVKLGEIDGLDLLVEIRNRHYDLPVILCTMYHAFKYDTRAIAADYYVVKSSNLGELKSRVKMAFESRHISSESGASNILCNMSLLQETENPVHAGLSDSPVWPQPCGNPLAG